jgi:hypothetical protein
MSELISLENAIQKIEKYSDEILSGIDIEDDAILGVVVDTVLNKIDELWQDGKYTQSGINHSTAKVTTQLSETFINGDVYGCKLLSWIAYCSLKKFDPKISITVYYRSGTTHPYLFASRYHEDPLQPEDGIVENSFFDFRFPPHPSIVGRKNPRKLVSNIRTEVNLAKMLTDDSYDLIEVSHDNLYDVVKYFDDMSSI